jgi:ABC-type molybdate transport system substrate-binding protein
MTELLPVKGITIAGVLPPSLQKTTTYSAAVMKVATSPKEAADLLGYLIGKEGRAEFVLRGFTTP